MKNTLIVCALLTALAGCQPAEPAFLTAQRQQERQAKDNCIDALRAKSDRASFMVEGSIPIDKTDAGWKVNASVSDVSGRYFATCYTDGAGNVLRLSVQ